MSEPRIVKRVSELLPGVPLERDPEVTGITSDSRQVEEGDLFLALRGAAADGRNFIPDAIAAGAAAILYEEEEAYTPLESSVPQIPVPDLKREAGIIASRFFDHPSSGLKVFAVTGTNGKTSCTCFIAAAMSALGEECAIIGTLGFGRADAPASFGLTTPGAVEMQRMLHRAYAEGARAVAIEASSHGLEQGRFTGTMVDVAVLTNVTRDHLDYHGSMAAYRAAKRVLFELPQVTLAVLNVDDEFGRELSESLTSVERVLTYSLEDRGADLHCTGIAADGNGLTAGISTPWGGGTLTSNLFGRFNLRNLLAVIAVLGSCGFGLAEILGAVRSLPTVKGRMDRVPVPGGIEVVIDYAHTPDALKHALSAAREHCNGALWCVFGCGGERDRGKRPEMGAIAAALADHVVVTDDNPRGEDSRAIASEIVAGIEERARVHVEIDRGAAIAYALRLAQEGDLVLLAGKGHETYQEVAGERRPFSDYAEVERFIEGRGNRV